MKYFTPEDSNPSEKTLNIIRQIAHSYRVITIDGKKKVFCLN